MSGLQTHVARNIRERDLIAPGDGVLVAVSGGVDSMVLLRLLSRLASRLDWHLTVAHFDHGLRGRESRRDREFVEAQALALGVPFVSGKAEVAIARGPGVSLEMAARGARHAFLAATAARLKVRTVALAHHANDQMEQFFLGLLRGGGGRALAGMRWRSPSPADPGLQLVRPLLDVAKAEITAFARRTGVPYREDSTNLCRDHLRNRVRLDLIPLLKRRYQKGLAGILGQSMEWLGDEARCVEELARQWRQDRGTTAFDALSPAVQRQVLLLELVETGIPPGFRLIEGLRAGAGRSMTVRPGLHVTRDGEGRVVAGPLVADRGGELIPTGAGLEIRGGEGQAEFGGVRFCWKTTRRRGPRIPAKTEGVEWFDADAVGDTIRLRHWRAGDRFQPIGMSSAVKLQDLFTNAKVPREERMRRIVAEAADGRVFWVEGLRIAEQFKLDNATTRQLKWQWQRAADVPGPVACPGSRC